jgi:Cyclic-phosphate processing Receiver domain
MRVWLDDLRPAPPGFDVHVTTANEAIALLKTGSVTHLSLDHDLGDPANGTGYEVARWVEEHAFRWAEQAADGLPPLTWNIHSQNPVGVENMTRAMRNADRFWRTRP